MVILITINDMPILHRTRSMKSILQLLRPTKVRRLTDLDNETIKHLYCRHPSDQLRAIELTVLHHRIDHITCNRPHDGSHNWSMRIPYNAHDRQTNNQHYPGPFSNSPISGQSLDR